MLEHLAAHIHLFGGLRLVFPPFTIREGTLATKAAAVVKLLAIRPGHSAHRDEVTGTLWADADERHGANNLYKALHQLRAKLPAEAHDLVQIRCKVVSLAPWATVDLDQFLTEAEVARGTKSVDAYDRVFSLSTRKFLPCDIYEDWTIDTRDAINRLETQMRFEAAELCVLNDDASRAAANLRAVVASEPANERAHRLLIEVYASNGEPANAVRQYEECVKTLRALGLTPSEDTTALFARLKSRPHVA